MTQLQYTPTEHDNCKYVFIQIDTVKRPLIYNSQGPFKIIGKLINTSWANAK